MRVSQQELLSCKDLALYLKRSLSYIYAMRKRGFKMPGNRASICQALSWLAKNPPPCRKVTNGK